MKYAELAAPGTELFGMTTSQPQERFVTSTTAQLWTIASGHGVPLILFNGDPGCDDYLAPIAQMVDDVCRVDRVAGRAPASTATGDTGRAVGDAAATRAPHGCDVAPVVAAAPSQHAGRVWARTAPGSISTDRALQPGAAPVANARPGTRRLARVAGRTAAQPGNASRRVAHLGRDPLPQ